MLLSDTMCILQAATMFPKINMTDTFVTNAAKKHRGTYTHAKLQVDFPNLLSSEPAFGSDFICCVAYLFVFDYTLYTLELCTY